MYCPNCGSQNKDGAKFCHQCGTSLVSQTDNSFANTQANQAQPNANDYSNQAQSNANYYANQAQSNANYYANQAQPNANYYANQAQPNANYYANQPQQNANYYPNAANSLPMKWHHFLVYFGIWACAVLNLVQGILYITGLQYENIEGYEAINKDVVYFAFPSMQTVDIAFSIGMFVCSAFALFVGYAMLNFKKGAPTLLNALYITVAAVSLAYCIAVVIILTSESNADIETIAPIISASAGIAVGSIIAIIANTTYYKKRAHLFVN